MIKPKWFVVVSVFLAIIFSTASGFYIDLQQSLILFFRAEVSERVSLELKELRSGSIDQKMLDLIAKKGSVRCVRSSLNGVMLFSPAGAGECEATSVEGSVDLRFENGTQLYAVVSDEKIENLIHQFQNKLLLIAGLFLVFVLLGGVFFARYTHELYAYLVDTIEYVAMGLGKKSRNHYLLDTQKTDLSVAELAIRANEYFELKSTEKKSIAALRLASQVSHDIRSPLGALALTVSSLENISSDAKKLIEDSILRIKQIANSLLNQSWVSRRISDSSFEGSSEELLLVDPDELVLSIVNEKRVTLPKSILVEAAIQAGVARIRVQPTEWSRILSNLLNNAAEAYEARAGKITVTRSFVEGQYLLTISDQGKGIDPKSLSLVGSVGFTTKESGNGLGLSHALETIKRWGGTLLVDSALGKGTVVSVRMPAEPGQGQDAWVKRRFGLGKADGQTQFEMLFETLEQFKTYYRNHFEEFDDVGLYLVSPHDRDRWVAALSELGLLSSLINR